jgi:hypothetical protein
LAPGQAPPDHRDFETRLAATPKDPVPRPDPGDRSSVLFIAHEYIEKWFIELALDDFGTGYLSLSHLKSLCVAAFKIDHSFVGDLATIVVAVGI